MSLTSPGHPSLLSVVQSWETRTAIVERTGAGVVVVRIHDGARQSLDDARSNLAAAMSASGGCRCPLLVDIRHAEPLDAEVRHHYTGQLLVESFSAIAMLVEASPFGRTMGNVYLRVARPGIPTQLFVDEPRAVEWLMRQRR